MPVKMPLDNGGQQAWLGLSASEIVLHGCLTLQPAGGHTSAALRALKDEREDSVTGCILSRDCHYQARHCNKTRANVTR